MIVQVEADEAERLEATLATAHPGRFRVLRQLGQGGMGTVWEVEDRARGERVAIKTLLHFDPHALLRFKNEFRSAREVHHPNLVRLGELFESRGTWFFTMELVAGRDLLGFFRDADTLGEESTLIAAEAPSSRRGAALPARPVDAASVRAVFSQLAAAIAVLHEHGLIHRDIKPGNVRVTAEGRAVLLDFGLVSGSAVAPSIDGGIVGTVSYMAPEQASNGTVGPAADWYAFGATLYEVLTGRVPFDGSVVQVLLDKQRAVPPAPSAVAPAVPADLEALCMALLSFDPRARPTAAEILNRLGDSGVRARPSTSTRGPLFVGRRAELSLLHDALVQVGGASGTAMTVHLTGEPGIGKTALASQFGSEASADGALVLRGRCYEHESVPFKALDGIVDSLASALQRMPRDKAAALTPRYAALLLRLFPVLGRVDAFRGAAEGRHAPGDPLEQRRRAFGALRELLAKIAEVRRLVLIIDDVQWSDPDGIDLLRSTLAPPDPPALLLVLTSSGSPLGGWPTPVRPIVLPPLEPEQAAELARALLGEGGLARVDALVRETNGHPLLLAELARQSAMLTWGGSRSASLRDLVTQTFIGLPQAARTVIELVALAGAPVSQRVLARAMDRSVGEIGRLVGSLRVARMVRTDRSTDLELVECIHALVRDAVLERVSAEVAKERHLALGTALEQEPGTEDDEAIARHLQQAGHVPRAIALWERAAVRASEALAFERAASLYVRILEHDPGAAPERRRSLQRRCAEAFVGAGRGREAAAAFVEAARGANVAEGIELKRLAAGNLLRSGHIDDGLALLRQVLADVGQKLPSSGPESLVTLLWHRWWIRARGYRFVWRDESEVPASTLTLVDALAATCEANAWLESIAAAGANARYVRAALAAGEPRRIVRALHAEAAFLAMMGASTARQVARALDAAGRIVERLGDPVLAAQRVAVTAIVTYFQGRFVEALPALERGRDVVRAAGGAVYFELTMLNALRLACLTWLGHWNELARSYAEVTRDADARGDLWARTLARLLMTRSAPIGQRAADHQEVLDAAFAPWKNRRFGLPHFLYLSGYVDFALAEGRAADALRAQRAAADDVRRSFILRSEMLRVIHWRDSARVLISMNDRSLDRAIFRCIGQLRRERVAYARGYAALFEARMLVRARRRAEALTALDHADRFFVDLPDWRPLVDWLRGRLRGGALGAKQMGEAQMALKTSGKDAEVEAAWLTFGRDLEVGPD